MTQRILRGVVIGVWVLAGLLWAYLATTYITGKGTDVRALVATVAVVVSAVAALANVYYARRKALAAEGALRLQRQSVEEAGRLREEEAAARQRELDEARQREDEASRPRLSLELLYGKENVPDKLIMVRMENVGGGPAHAPAIVTNWSANPAVGSFSVKVPDGVTHDQVAPVVRGDAIDAHDEVFTWLPVPPRDASLEVEYDGKPEQHFRDTWRVMVAAGKRQLQRQ